MEFQRAYLLHRRPYRDNSAIVDLLTEHDGRIAAIVRLGSGKKDNKRALLQPFSCLNVTYVGRGDLVTLTNIEPVIPLKLTNLVAERLYSGFYLNELLMRLLPKYISCSELFERYSTVLIELAQQDGQDSIERVLRSFEMALLTELGIQPNLNVAHWREESVEYVHYVPVVGLQPVYADQQHLNALPIDDVIKISLNQLTETGVLTSYKKLMRAVLAEQLGNKPLKSRALFQTMRTQT